MRSSIVCYLAKILEVNFVIDVLGPRRLDRDFEDKKGCQGTNFSVYNGWLEEANQAATDSVQYPTVFNCLNGETCVGILTSLSTHQRKSTIMLVSEDDVSHFKASLKLYDTIFSYNTSTGVIYEWFGVKGNAFKLPYATIKQDNSLVETISSQSKWDRRSSLHGVELRVTALHWDPLSLMKKTSPDESAKWTGAFNEIVRELGRLLNFTLTFSSPSDGEWGVQKSVSNDLETSFWSGMIGELIADNADISTGGLAISLERTEVIDYSPKVVSFPLTILDRNPYHPDHATDIQGISFTSFLKTFTLTSWFGVFCMAWVCSICFLVLLSCYEHKFPTVKRVMNMASHSWVIIGLSILTLGVDMKHSQASRRILTFTVVMFGFFIFVSYTSDLTAIMTVGSSFSMPTTFEELYEQGYEVIVSKGTLSVTILKKSPKGSGMRNIYESRLEQIEWPSNIKPLIDNIAQSEKTVYYGSAIDMFNEDKVVPIKGFKEPVPTSFRLGYQKDSEFADLFNFHILRMIQTGALDNIVHQWFQSERPDGDMTDRIFVEEAPPLGSDNFFFPAFVLSLAIMLSLTIAVIECLQKRTAN